MKDFHKILIFTICYSILTSCGDASRGDKSDPVSVTSPVQDITDQILLDGLSKIIFTNAFRDRGMPQITQSVESISSVDSTSPYYYRDITEVSNDDEGGHASSVIIKNLRPDTECGTAVEQNSIVKKMEDCKSKNSFSSWEGEGNGISAESNWHLVVRTSAGSEIWFDAATKLLWSENMGVGNWCKASGNSENLPVGGQMVSCSTIGSSENWCGDTALKTDEKGGIDSSLVSWRLPTRNDFFQADIDGIRFVVSNINKDFWSATIYSAARQNAWFYNGVYGTVSTIKRDNATKNIRCVGRIVE